MNYINFQIPLLSVPEVMQEQYNQEIMIIPNGNRR